MKPYVFRSVWCLRAPVDVVWDAITDSLHWPEWWRGVRRVEEIEAERPGGLGHLRRYEWRSLLPYSLLMDIRSTETLYPETIKGTIEGALQGTGFWHLHQDGDICTVQYDMTVVTTKWWMKLTAPYARPLYRWNHHQIMRWGAEGLAARLNAELLSCDEQD
jgi:hypothetical protein